MQGRPCSLYPVYRAIERPFHGNRDPSNSLFREKKRCPLAASVSSSSSSPSRERERSIEIRTNLAHRRDKVLFSNKGGESTRSSRRLGFPSRFSRVERKDGRIYLTRIFISFFFRNEGRNDEGGRGIRVVDWIPTNSTGEKEGVEETILRLNETRSDGGWLCRSSR